MHAWARRSREDRRTCYALDVLMRRRHARANTRVIVAVPVLDYGGIESHTITHALKLQGHVESLRVCCLTCDGAAADLIRRAGVPVDVLHTNPSVRDPRATYRLWRYLRRQAPTVVHLRTGAMTVHGLLAAAAAGVPVRIAEEVGLPQRGRLGKLLFPWLYRLACRVVGVSDAVVEHLITHDGVNAARVVRIYNPVDDRFFPEQAPPAREQASSILTVGRLVPEKAQEVLLRATAALRESVPDARLIVAGDGPLRTSLEAQARQLGLDDAVRFVGHRRDVAELLAEADVFVLPSRSEGMGVALVEAMASQVPCVASAVGGIPEVLGEAGGYLVAPGDVQGLAQAMESLLKLSSGARQAIGRAHAERAQQLFGADQYVRNVLDLYETCLTEAGMT
jgi:glycosyltransferase involved in cell wall biosynthesis